MHSQVAATLAYHKRHHPKRTNGPLVTPLGLD
jgi:hypothetical protein